jgi:hypothetical protein
MDIIINKQTGKVIGVSSWTTGLKPLKPVTVDLRKEAQRNLEAVINRLCILGRFDEAERIFDEFA